MELKNRFANLPLDTDFIDPPGPKRANKRGSNTIPISFFKPSLTNPDTCPKFLLIEHADPNQTLLKISPFAIQKGLDMITKGLDITRLRNGNLLVKTKNNSGAEKLLSMTSLGGIVGVSVKIHPTLNQSKGVITCRDLLYESEENITNALAKQHVISTQRIKRKIDGNLIDTHSLILTFRTPDIPDTIQAAFYNLKVRPYIPSPLRCTNCQRFGHSRGRCRTERICSKCALPANHDECTNKKCVNCNNLHYSFDRKCPRYIEESEITKIKTIYRLTYPEAKKQYKLKNPVIPNITFAEIAKSSIQNNLITNKTNFNPNSKKPEYTNKNTATNNTTSNEQMQNQVPIITPIATCSKNTNSHTFLPTNITTSSNKSNSTILTSSIQNKPNYNTDTNSNNIYLNHTPLSSDENNTNPIILTSFNDNNSNYNTKTKSKKSFLNRTPLTSEDEHTVE